MNTQKLKNWPLFNAIGVFCVVSLILVFIFGHWENIRTALVLGIVVSLPWAVIAVFARLTEKSFFKFVALGIPLIIGLLFINSEFQINSPISFLMPVVYFASVYGVGWLFIRLLLVVLTKTGKKN